MKRILYILFLFGIRIFGQSDTTVDVLTVNFEDNVLGAYDEDSVNKYWDVYSMGWVYDDLTIVDCTNVTGATSRMLQVPFAKGEEEHHRGLEFQVDLGAEYSEVYLTYNIKYVPTGAGFSRFGFKNPGIRGFPTWVGFDPPGDEEGFTALIHTSAIKEQRSYDYYHNQSPPEYGELFMWGALRMQSNRWYTVTQRLVMNSFDGVDDPNEDGIFEGFIDRRKLIGMYDMEWFENNDPDTFKFDGLHFAIFCNEDPEEREYETMYILIDDIKVYQLDEDFADAHYYAYGLGDTNALGRDIYVPVPVASKIDNYDSIYTDTTTTFKDKNGDSDYDNMTDELYKIYVKLADSIVITVNLAEVEDDYDIFSIINDWTTITPHYVYNTRDDITGGTKYTVYGENVIIRLTSDYSSVDDGFSITYHAHGNEDMYRIAEKKGRRNQVMIY